MNYNTQNAKIASITEKTLIVGIDVGSETHYARAFDWRNYEYTKKSLEFSNTEAGFLTLKTWVTDIAEKYGKTAVIPGMEPTYQKEQPNCSERKSTSLYVGRDEINKAPLHGTGVSVEKSIALREHILNDVLPLFLFNSGKW